MPTITLDPDALDLDLIDPAARALARGELVAFPTETVYGLGAMATDPAAVAKIFAAKGRPSDNPLIVHVRDITQAKLITRAWPAMADALASAFWPGPLTLVLPRADAIPDIVSAGLDSVGVRVPSHPVARALIDRAGVPVCAPSANRYTHISPTRAEHVRASLGDRVSWLIDAGATQVGLESTVVSLLDDEVATILRPGMISRARLEGVLGQARVRALDEQDRVVEKGAARSPGLAKKHYAPDGCQVLLVENIPWERIEGEDGVLLLREDTGRPIDGRARLRLVLGDEPGAYAARLYEALHEVERAGCSRAFIELPPSLPAWQAVLDRLSRAAS